MSLSKQNEKISYSSIYYQRLLAFAALAHLGYFFEFLWLGALPLVLFNVGSVAMYALLQIFARGGKYKLLLLLTHLEVCTFSCLATILLGWACGYQLLMLSVATLVYFCPYKNRYVPYLFSLGEMFLFICMRLLMMRSERAGTPPACLLTPDQVEIVYLINVAFAFLVVIVASIVCNISTALSEDELMRKNRALQQIALYDPLTKLMNRRAMQPEMEKALSRFVAGEGPLSVMMCDIDNFKRVNDQYGHRCGDMVLHRVAEILAGTLAGGGLACRWGGEEFVVALPGLTLRAAAAKAEELRARVEGAGIPCDAREIRVTVTFGVCCAWEGATVEDLILCADRLMYEGKRNGRNRVVWERPARGT